MSDDQVENVAQQLVTKIVSLATSDTVLVVDIDLIVTMMYSQIYQLEEVESVSDQL